MDFASPLILLIPLTLALIFLLRLGSNAEGLNPFAPWQGDFLVSTTIWGALIVVITEALSFFELISQLSLAIAWALGAGIALANARCEDRLKRGWGRFRELLRLDARFERWTLAVMAVYIGVLFVIAVAAPSNNVDAMQYHLPRALHWLQNGSLQHYPTARIAQDIRPYWAEAAILHLRGLWGNDRPVNLVQWFSMIGSIVAATGIARLLGGRRRGAWLTRRSSRSRSRWACCRLPPLKMTTPRRCGCSALLILWS
jgi:hypothetical protein